jgi:AcrR family transcriptional regulator
MCTTSAHDYRKQRLLQATADYLLGHGLGDLSLRPLATALGTSARMLVYYFGSKEELLVEALSEVRRRQYVDLYREEATAGDPLRQYWQWASSASRRTYLKLLSEVYGRAVRDPEAYGGFLRQEAIDWLEFCEAGYRRLGLAPEEATALATWTMAAVRGLELDLLTSGDVDRVQVAFEMFAEDVDRRAARLRKASRSGR